MKIAINTRLLIKNKIDGIGRYTYEISKRLAINHPNTTFFFLFDRPYSKDFIFSDNVKPIVVFPQARHPLLYYWWFEYALPKVFKQIQPDLFFSPEGYLSLNSNIPQINVIHDLNFEHYPEFLPFAERKFYRKYFPRYAHKAKQIITVSEFSKNDIVQKYNILPEKIKVIYNGISEFFSPIDKSRKEQIKQQYSAGYPYFIFVGTIHQRKNIANQILAFNKFKEDTALPHKFLLAGNKKWWSSDIKRAYETSPYKKDIVFLGRLPDKEIKNLLGASEGLVYVSYFEGFGLPLLEAMQCNVPVLTANVSSLPEIGGEAVFYASPHNIDEIAHQLKIIACHQPEVEAKKKLYASVLQKFNWETAEKDIFSTFEKNIKL